MNNTSEKDIDNLLNILDSFCEAGEGRMKLEVSEELSSGDTKHAYHHGRCDIGSLLTYWKMADAETTEF